MSGTGYTYQVEASDNGDIWVIDGSPNDPPTYIPEAHLPKPGMSATDVALHVLTNRAAEGFADDWSDTPHSWLRVVVWHDSGAGDEDEASAIATIHNLTNNAEAARRGQ